MASEYVNSKEAAKTLGYTLQHTRLLVREGRLRGSKFGRDWLIERNSVDELAEQREQVHESDDKFRS